VCREIDTKNMVLLGDEDQLSKIAGMKERFTFTPTITPFGPLESFKPSIILRGQASKWEKAPRKQSERVENPNFDKNKPISEKNIQFHEVFFRDFPVRFSNMTNHARFFFNFNKGWLKSWFAFSQFRGGSFNSHLSN
jgi:hypothetical protein